MLILYLSISFIQNIPSFDTDTIFNDKRKKKRFFTLYYFNQWQESIYLKDMYISKTVYNEKYGWFICKNQNLVKRFLKAVKYKRKEYFKLQKKGKLKIENKIYIIVKNYIFVEII